MIKSEMYRGKIFAGDTKLANTIRVEQTAPMQLTFRAGTFTHTDGQQWALDSDVSVDLMSDANYPTMCQIEIGVLAGTVNVWCGLQRMDGVEEMNPPAGWIGHLLVLPFIIPPGATSLPDIYVITVEPGFPDGTTAQDWKIQMGAA